LVFLSGHPVRTERMERGPEGQMQSAPARAVFGMRTEALE